MNELSEATIRMHVRRRAGEPIDARRVDRMSRSVMVRLDTEPRPSARLLSSLPVGARVGLAAALVVAVSVIAIPLVAGPGGSPAPSGTSAPASAPASAPEADALQVLSLQELQRVVGLGDTAFRGRLVVADVDIRPDSQPPQCVYGLDDQLSLLNPCWVDGSVAGSDPPIHVVQPSRDTDILRTTIPARGVTGPILARVGTVDTIELLGELRTSVGNVSWSTGSFVKAVDRIPRTLEYAPNRFLVGPPFIVGAKLLHGPSVYCRLEGRASQSADRMGDFGCGTSAWLVPGDLSDPTTIGTSARRPPDWVRVQNAAAGDRTDRAFYVVLPLIKYNVQRCFDCGGGAVGILYARLEPVRIP